MASKSYRQVAIYLAVLAACFALGIIAGWWGPLGGRLDHYAYDEMTKRNPWRVPRRKAVVVGVDERTLESQGGVAEDARRFLTKALEQIAQAHPAAVAIDVILHDAGDEPTDAQLEAALRKVPNLILPCELVDGKWEDPLPRMEGPGSGPSGMSSGKPICWTASAAQISFRAVRRRPASLGYGPGGLSIIPQHGVPPHSHYRIAGRSTNRQSGDSGGIGA